MLALFYRLGSHPLAHEEPRRALIGLELIYGDDPLQPTLHGENYYRKPPLYNWVIAGCYWITGKTSEAVSRLPTVISFLLIAWFMYWFGRKYTDRNKAVLAAIIFLASEDLVLYYSRMAEMDLFYSLLTLPVILLPWHYLNSGSKWRFFIIPSFIAALGFLAKGFPSVAFLGISMLAAIFIHKQYKLIWHPMVLVSVAVFVLPTLIYFLPQYQAGTLEDSLNTLFGESANRTGGKSILDRLSHLVIFPLDTLKGMLPFSLLILGLRKRVLASDFTKAIAVLFLANFALYWLSPGARLRYIYVLFPLLAFVLAEIGLSLKPKIQEWIDKGTHLLLLVVMVFLLVLMVYFNALDAGVIMAMLAGGIILYLRKSVNWSLGLICLMFLARIGIDFIAGQPEVLTHDKAHMEKQDAQRLFEAHGESRVYLNSRAEEFYTFSYEYTRLTQRVLRHNEALDDQQGIYIVRRASKPEELEMLSDFKIGKDTSFILARWP